MKKHSLVKRRCSEDSEVVLGESQNETNGLVPQNVSAVWMDDAAINQSITNNAATNERTHERTKTMIFFLFFESKMLQEMRRKTMNERRRNLFRLFVCSFVCSFLRSFLCLFVPSFVPSGRLEYPPTSDAFDASSFVRALFASFD